MNAAALFNRVSLLQNGLISFSTGGGFSEGESYEELRKQVIADARTRDLVPDCVRRNRDLDQFWQFIKHEFGTYAERRQYIWFQFNPLLQKLEISTALPGDDHISGRLQKCDPDSVQRAWQKALERRNSDPEGAITAARTLLESVCKYILDEDHVEYGSDADLPKLYRLTAEHLNIAPSQHSEQIFKQILGGCTAVVEGLGALRNRISDAHGQGSKPVRPASRHATLAVNLSGSMAGFLVDTWEVRKK
jgi:Abortive infection C-terminus